MKTLVLNSGSSTLKAACYEIGAAPPPDPAASIWQGQIDWDGSHGDVRSSSPAGPRLAKQIGAEGRRGATEELLSDLWSGVPALLGSPSDIHIVGHRIVHGGEISEPTFVTPSVKETIRRMSVFAPLHNPAGLEGIEMVEQILGAIPQVAVFDTAFHSRLPEAAAVYAGPYEWFSRGIRRYGFHGINHEYCAERAARLLGRELRSLKLVTCHLGNGCSLAAVGEGKSIDTTMGFTPLEGLAMGTRSGSIDPSILTFLMRHDHLAADELDQLLNTKSGLAGISGLSNDMRQIVSAMKAGHSRARLAFDIFIHRLTSLVGAMVAVLGGIDALVFTAGIGENSADVRQAACANLGFLGARLDPSKNSQAPQDGDIAASDSRVRILVVRAQEDWAIACRCWNLARSRVSGASRAGQ
jgi:acetate kinase